MRIVRLVLTFFQNAIRLRILVPQGRLKVVQDCIAAYFQPSLRDWVVLSNPTQD
jgi:hypothetical protein